MARRIPRSRIGLAAAAVLFAALVVALLLTSTPVRSPASTWLTWAWQLRYRAFAVEDTATLRVLHRYAAEGSREQCVACHGDKRSSKLPLHRIHLRSELLPRLHCHECHQKVELGPRGSTSAARWVDVGFCKKCHSAFPGLKSGSHMQAEDIDADCTMCHTGARAIRHAQPYLSQIMPTSECKGCHGGRVLPWTPLHERDDWLEEHGSEALRSGTHACFECHDFGLKFCDECHAEKPPSHEPEDRWLAVHPDEARTDTRVCYSCHETSHCKKCHVNHEDGWMKAHPAFVRERGNSSCLECHSLSACAYCHVEDPGYSADGSASSP